MEDAASRDGDGAQHALQAGGLAQHGAAEADGVAGGAAAGDVEGGEHVRAVVVALLQQDVARAPVVGEHAGGVVGAEEGAEAEGDQGVVVDARGRGGVCELEAGEREAVGDGEVLGGVDVADAEVQRDVGEAEGGGGEGHVA